MNQSLSIFQFEGNQVRIATDTSGDPWFVVKDVCDALGLQSSRKVLLRLDDDEKGVTIDATPGGQQMMNTVSESGLYTLVFKSRKPFARKFRRWVTHEVIPAIRKRGYYYNYPVADGGMDQAAGLVMGLAKHLVTLEQRIDKLEERGKKLATALAPVKEVSTRTKLSHLIRGYVESNQKSYAEVWGKLYEEFKQRYHVDLWQRTSDSRNKSGLDIAESIGAIDDLYSLAQALFVEGS